MMPFVGARPYRYILRSLHMFISLCTLLMFAYLYDCVTLFLLELRLTVSYTCSLPLFCTSLSFFLSFSISLFSCISCFTFFHPLIFLSLYSLPRAYQFALQNSSRTNHEPISFAPFFPAIFVSFQLIAKSFSIYKHDLLSVGFHFYAVIKCSKYLDSRTILSHNVETVDRLFRLSLPSLFISSSRSF